MAEPPYGIIWDLLKRGEVIPFLGAGASRSGRPLKAKWDGGQAGFLPTGHELARLLAEEARFPASELIDLCNQFKTKLDQVQIRLKEAQAKLAAVETELPELDQVQAQLEEGRAKLTSLEAELCELDDLAKVASYYQENSDRRTLRTRLCRVFEKEYRPGQVHQFLADLEIPLLIVTTNYDDLIERAFESKEPPKPYHLVVHPTEHKEYDASVLWWKPGADEPEAHPPATLPLWLTDTTIIYKMHGSVDRQTNRWNSFVITEEDYVDFLSRMTGEKAVPKHLMLEFKKRYFLFLGYGLQDWNLRVILKNLKTVLAGIPASGGVGDVMPNDELRRSWAIQYQPSELERTLWDARDVKIYDVDIDTFVAQMREWMNREARNSFSIRE
jgi:hypothetical protein